MESEELTLEEFERQLRLYILGSFPLGWDEAKRRLLADKRLRLREQNSDELQGQAMTMDPLEQALTLLRRAHDQLQDEELRADIRALLATYNQG